MTTRLGTPALSFPRFSGAPFSAGSRIPISSTSLSSSRLCQPPRRWLRDRTGYTRGILDVYPSSDDPLPHCGVGLELEVASPTLARWRNRHRVRDRALSVGVLL